MASERPGRLALQAPASGDDDKICGLNSGAAGCRYNTQVGSRVVNSSSDPVNEPGVERSECWARSIRKQQQERY